MAGGRKERTGRRRGKERIGQGCEGKEGGRKEHIGKEYRNREGGVLVREGRASSNAG